MSNIKTPFELGQIAAQLGRSAFENPYFCETVAPEHTTVFMDKFHEWADGWLKTNAARIAVNAEIARLKQEDEDATNVRW